MKWILKCLDHSSLPSIVYFFLSQVYWLFEKYWFTELYRSSKCGHILLCNNKKSHLSIAPSISSDRQSFSFGKVQAHGGRQKFPKIVILTQNLKFYHLQQILSLVFLAVTGSFHSFLRECLPSGVINTQVHLVNFLSHTWSQPFYKDPSILFCGRWYLEI